MGVSADPTNSLRRFGPNLAGTTRAGWLPDLVAGATVAAIAVPQALAYALVAGLPPEMGLLAAAVPAVVAALFGSSPYLVTGPTNPTALMLGVAVVLPAMATGGARVLDAVVMTGLLVSLMLLGFVLIGLGRVSRFLSDSVIAGFATGAGVLIALHLLPTLAAEGGAHTPPLPFAPIVWGELVAAVDAITRASPRALVIGLAVPGMVLALRRLGPRFPATLLVLTLTAGGVHLLGWGEGQQAVAFVGAVDFAWRPPALPSAVDPIRLAGPALAIALLVTLQTIAAARTVRPPGGPPLDPDRELMGQGLANFAGALTGAMPCSGSLTRTAVARSAGARSRLAALTAGVLVTLGLPWIGSLLAHVPTAALVGIVFLSGIQLIDPRALRRAGATRGDAAVLVVTFLATLSIELVQALYVGVFLSLALLVRRSGDLHMVELVRSDAGRFREVAIDELTGSKPAALLHLEGDLNFAVAGKLSEQLREIGGRGTRVVVLRLKRARHLDATLLEALRECVLELQASGVRVILCGVTAHLANLLRDTEVGRLLGSDGLLPTGERLFEGFERALALIREELAPASDDEIFRTERAGAWLYEI